MSPDDAALRSVATALRRAMDGTVGKKNPRPEVLDEARAAALEAAKVVAGPDGRLSSKVCDELTAGLPVDVRAWLLELPSFLAKKGRKEQGLELCDLYAPILGAPAIDAERAVVQWESGAKEEGKQALAAARASHPDHCWPELRSGYVCEQEQRGDSAREHYERAVDKARKGGDHKELRFTWDSLVQYHHERGDREQAMALSRQMLKECPEIEAELKIETIVNTAPEIGRNDPCSCGSGRKWKKCCGKAA